MYANQPHQQQQQNHLHNEKKERQNNKFHYGRMYKKETKKMIYLKTDISTDKMDLRVRVLCHAQQNYALTLMNCAHSQTSTYTHRERNKNQIQRNTLYSPIEGLSQHQHTYMDMCRWFFNKKNVWCKTIVNSNKCRNKKRKCKIQCIALELE